HALERHAKRLVVFLLQERNEQMRRLGIEHQEIEQGWLPRNEAGQLPIRPDPDSVDFIRIVLRQALEKIGLIVEISVLEMDRERHRVKHVSARFREVMHHLEYVV